MTRSEQRAVLASLIAGSRLRSGLDVTYDTAEGIVLVLERRLLATGFTLAVISPDDDRAEIRGLHEGCEVLGGDADEVK